MRREATLIFTDLDGTLLDRETYAWAPAARGVQELRERSIPLVFATSKTLAETVVMRERIGNRDPFVIENGAAAVVPDADGFRLERFGAPRESAVALLRDLRRQHSWRFEGFSDWTAAQLANKTGLAEEDASRALERCGSEPIEWLDSAENLEQLRQAVAEAGFRVVQGGRFHHVMGDFDKAGACAWLKTRYGPEVTVAFGDSPNDEAMLNQADIAVIVRSEHSESLRLSDPQRIIRTQQPGPDGWQEALDALLPELP